MRTSPTLCVDDVAGQCVKRMRSDQNVKICSGRFSAGFGAAVSCRGLMIGGGGSTAIRAAADVIGTTAGAGCVTGATATGATGVDGIGLDHAGRAGSLAATLDFGAIAGVGAATYGFGAIGSGTDREGAGAGSAGTEAEATSIGEPSLTK